MRSTAPAFLQPTTAPLMTIAGNKALTALTNVLFGSSLTDMETCYKVMRGDIAKSLALSADRFDIEPEITAQLAPRRLSDRGAAGALRCTVAHGRQKDAVARRLDGAPRSHRATAAPAMSVSGSTDRVGAWVTLALSGLIGYAAGSRWFAEWQVPVETAQVIAGIVRYPPGNPFLIYHLKLWTVLHQICAALLSAGVSEAGLSVVLGGVTGMVSSQALAMTAYAFSRSVWVSVVAAMVVFVSQATNYGVRYRCFSRDVAHLWKPGASPGSCCPRR